MTSSKFSHWFYFACFVFLITSSVPIYAQSELLTIVDAVNTSAIPYVLVKSLDGSQGYYADEDGQVPRRQIRSLTREVDTIRILALGYAEMKISSTAIEGTDTIRLHPSPLSFSESPTVVASKLKSRKFKFRNLYSKPVKAVQNDANTARVAQYVKVPESLFESYDYVLIREIAFHLQTILDDSRDSFLVNVYAFDERCSCPGQRLSLKSGVKPKAVYGWNSVSFNTPVFLPTNRFFVSFELLSPYEVTSPHSNGHTISYDRGGFPTYRQAFGSSKWVATRRYTNRDFYIKMELKGLFENSK